MPTQSHLEKVPKAMDDKYVAIIKVSDAYCREHLDDEYAQMIRDAAAALCRKQPSPILSGTPKSWAAGITHAVGMVNFLFDPNQAPHVTSSKLYEAFGVSQSKVLARSKLTRDLLDMCQMHPDWTLPALMDDNPLVWMLPINGRAVDARKLSRNTQVELHERGFIPYVHADRNAVRDTA